MSRLAPIAALAAALLLLTACGGDDPLDSLETEFNDIKMGMTMDQVNELVGEPDQTGPLEDSGGGMQSRWGENTRVFYDRDKKVTAVIHNGVPLELE